MKALSECKWKVEILDADRWWFWRLTTRNPTGLELKTLDGKNYNDRLSAIKDLHKFIELNGITCDTKKL